MALDTWRLHHEQAAGAEQGTFNFEAAELHAAKRVAIESLAGASLHGPASAGQRMVKRLLPPLPSGDLRALLATRSDGSSLDLSDIQMGLTDAY
eukprot:5428186-Heterocapsa_arctica.AAC.1